jgi:hypothetical protein
LIIAVARILTSTPIWMSAVGPVATSKPASRFGSTERTRSPKVPSPLARHAVARVDDAPPVVHAPVERRRPPEGVEVLVEAPREVVARREGAMAVPLVVEDGFELVEQAHANGVTKGRGGPAVPRGGAARPWHDAVGR